AGIALHVGGDGADLARAGHDMTVVVAAEIEARFLEFRIINLLQPLATAPRPMLIDQELVVIFDEKFGRVAGVVFGIAQRAAGDHQIAGEQRGTALAGQPLAYNEWLDSELVQIKRCIAAGGPASDDGHISRFDAHLSHPASVPWKRRHWMVFSR